ncbi:MAG: sigma-54-dependent Fis family transcriptional regulator [Planctomycetes bacterium]|nr:sigma-54-dependent Fis family transcriptional regulator [Planctomycetota bacterium]
MNPNPEPSELARLQVLVADDEPDLRLGMKRLVENLGAQVDVVADGEAALRRLEAQPYHLLLSDVRMPGLSGDELLRVVKKRWPDCAVVLVTGFGSIEQAVACMRQGAEYFIAKPFDNRELQRTVQLVGRRQLAQEAQRPEAEKRIVAGHGPMRNLLDELPRLAATRLPVLISGETGTGKELIAREIHRLSRARALPFLAVNCAALPDTLLESELFGYREGAFTGAHGSRRGLFELAAGGTVFLDEVTSMSPAFQGKLLRVLQNKVVRPLGADEDVAVEFRLLSATNRDLGEMVASGTFRDDLLYRLRVLEVEIPPLRARRHDVPLIAEHLIERLSSDCRGAAAPKPKLDDSARTALSAHEWPGNVRELENVILRALVRCTEDEISAADLDVELAAGASAVNSYDDAKQQAIRNFQRRFVRDALRREGGNISHAAQACGMTRAALQRILKNLDIDVDEFRH